MRDDFSVSTKEILASRVGYRCSNPYCRKLTVGPHVEAKKHINIGVAAHITAASENGPRYDPVLTGEERKSLGNGIWLCQTCAKLIDSDEKRYTVDLLDTWKSISEQLAIAELQTVSQAKTAENDIKLIEFYSQCFDRPAFIDFIRCEGTMESFDKAIEDTIIALNTGVLRSRDGCILKSEKGKSCIYNSSWRNKLDTIVEILVSVRKRLRIAQSDNAYYVNTNKASGESFYCFNDHELEHWFDNTRREVLRVFSSICREAGLPLRNRNYF